MKVRCLHPGLLTTIQDLGRPGFRNYGVPEGGVMDRRSTLLANELVGNPIETPVLEITMMGPKLEFEGVGHIAITGADFELQLNSLKVESQGVIPIKSGDVLIFGKCKTGCRAYLAIAGKWDTERWLGSASALPFSQFPILSDHVLRKGSVINIDQVQMTCPSKQIERYSYPPNPIIRMIRGPEYDWFDVQELALFFSIAHRIGPQSNRMGYQLDSRLTYPLDKSLISSPVVPGTIQVARSGAPIVLMRDAQTTGGYPRLGNIVDKDLDVLAQLKPGDRFMLTTTSL